MHVPMNVKFKVNFLLYFIFNSYWIVKWSQIYPNPDHNIYVTHKHFYFNL